MWGRFRDARLWNGGGLFGFLEFVAWTAVVLGIGVALFGASAGGSIGGRGPAAAGTLAAVGGALPGIILSVVGLIGAAMAQFARAGVDTAEMTGKMLEIARKQIDATKSMNSKLSAAPAQSGKPSAEPASPPPKEAVATPASGVGTTTEDASEKADSQLSAAVPHAQHVPGQLDALSRLPGWQRDLIARRRTSQA